MFRYCASGRLISIDEKRSFYGNDLDKVAQKNDKASKESMIRNFDKKFGAKDRDLKVDDMVLYRRPRGKIFDKMEPVCDPNAW